jgi:tetratricopeptide (TPR) repeat protein
MSTSPSPIISIVENIFFIKFRKKFEISISEQLFKEGVKAEDEQDWLTAMEKYNLAFTLDPTNRKAACNRGALLLDIYKPMDAIITIGYLKAISGYEDSITLSILGCALYDMGNFEMALSAFKKALNKDPHNKDYIEQVIMCEEILKETQTTD